MVGDSGIEPLTSSVSTKRSTSELTALIYIQLYKIFATCQEFSLNSKVVNFVPGTILTVFDQYIKIAILCYGSNKKNRI